MSYQEFIIAAVVSLLVGGVLVQWLLFLFRKVRGSFVFYKLTPKLLEKYKADNK